MKRENKKLKDLLGITKKEMKEKFLKDFATSAKKAAKIIKGEGK